MSEKDSSTPIAVVLLRAGMTELTDSDILHLREKDQRSGITSPDEIAPDQMNDLIKYNLGLRCRYFELMICGPTQKHFVEKLVHLMNTTRTPKPIIFRYLDEHYAVACTHLKVSTPDQSLLRNYVIRVGVTLWPYKPRTGGSGVLNSEKELNFESVILFEVQESEPRCVHWIGECAFYMADYTRWLIDYVKQIYPQAEELQAQRARSERERLTRADDDDENADKLNNRGVANIEKADWNQSAVRELLTVAFDDEKVIALCSDYFRPVYEDFGSGMSKGQKIQRWLDYCLRHDKMEQLLEMIQKHNPTQYTRFEGRLKK
jgi:hypothetical protein